MKNHFRYNPVVMADILKQIRMNFVNEDSELDKILWRYKMGWCEENEVLQKLDKKIDELINRYSKHRDQKGALRRYIKTDLITFEECLNKASRYVENINYEKSAIQIKKATKLLVHLERSLSIIEKHEMVKKRFDSLKSFLGRELFDQTLSFKIFTRCLALSEKSIKEGKPQKSTFYLKICNDDLESLMTKDINECKQTELNQKTIKFTKELKRIQSVRHSDSYVNYFQKLNKIKKLIKDCQLSLAERLLEEFEIEIGDKLTFISEQDRMAKILQISNTQKLNVIADSVILQSPDYWDKAAIKLLEDALQFTLSRLGNQSNRIASLYQKEIENEGDK